MSNYSASDILAAIPNKFAQALEAGDVHFFPSTVKTHRELDIPFEIRLCPALQKKPDIPTLQLDEDDSEKKQKQRPDPFSPPYVPNLFIGYPSNDHVVLLNKFSIIEHHFLLVTKEYQSQASPLLPHDLVQSFEFIKAAKALDRHYFAFYNCGDLSGASQPHKHIQFLPIQSPDGPPIEHLARSVHLEKPNTPFSLPNVPYANYVYRFPPNVASLPSEDLEELLVNAFLSLLDLTVSTIRHSPEYPTTTANNHRLSYNVVLTREHMHLIPRAKESCQLSQSDDDISVNALGFAGMMLVKSEEEMEAVVKESVGNILRAVGLESRSSDAVHELTTAEA